jgi:hypothetical protein
MPRLSRQNPDVDRLIGLIRRECLNHIIIFDAHHLRVMPPCRAGLFVRIGKYVKHGANKRNDARKGRKRRFIRHMLSANR